MSGPCEMQQASTITVLQVPSVLPAHPNIVRQYDAFLDVSTNSNCYIYAVMEPMEGNLYHLMRARRGKPFAAGLMMSMFYRPRTQQRVLPQGYKTGKHPRHHDSNEGLYDAVASELPAR